jgi:hypothetical protein
MKAQVYKQFKAAVMAADEKALIWHAGFHFLALTEKQADDLRRSTLEKWGDSDGVVHYPNGISIKP